VYQCPGLAIFGYNPNKETLFLPVELEVNEGAEVFLVDNYANKLGEGKIDKILRKKNLTNIARVKTQGMSKDELVNVRGFIAKQDYPEKLDIKPYHEKTDDSIYMCHCDDVKLEEVMQVIGDRKFISVEEIKHTTHLGMGPCRGKRCLLRLRQSLGPKGISIIGHPTPRAPLSNQIMIGELYPANKHENIITSIHNKKPAVKVVKSFVAGGGIGGSALFRYLAEEGKAPVLINFGFGSSWRNIAGGRPQFSLPELSDIARHNLELFKELDKTRSIDFKLTNYITFAHDKEMLKTLEASLAWQEGIMLKPSQFRTDISPYYNASNTKYLAALKTGDCWQATPGKVMEALRQIAMAKGGTLLENCELIDVDKKGSTYFITARTNDNEYVEFQTEIFINAMGGDGEKFARQLGIETGLYPVKHQAFITRRLPMLGVNGGPLEMLIDRRKYKGFTAVYGQQLAETGQIIGCASPQWEPMETGKDVKYNALNFIEIVSEIFTDWIPEISSVGFQALWSGYYTEPRMIIDPKLGLFLGLRGQGFMLGQYLAKLYVDKLMGRETPSYFKELEINGSALLEKAFK